MSVVARDAIMGLERLMMDQSQVDLQVVHHFAPGVYARELRIPKGVLLTGKIHKTEHLNIVSQGKIVVVSQFGREIIKAPHTMISKPGVKRVGYALEDTVWTTIHVTEKTDPELIEDDIIAESFDAFDKYIEAETTEKLT